MSSIARQNPGPAGMFGKLEPLGPLGRSLGLGLAWLLLYLAGPGIVTGNGLFLLAPFGVGVWALFASRPGRWSFWIEVALGCAAWCGICSWAAKVHWSSLLFIGPGFGLYYASAGALLRRLSVRYPLVIAAPAAWLGIETLRTVLEPPFGLSWMRLGIHAHDVPWLAGSARVYGVFGLTYVLVAAGAGLAQWGRAAALEGAERRAHRRWALAGGGGPLLLALVLSFATEPPEFERGPRVLLVQPAIPQQRKMQSRTFDDLYLEGMALTRHGLDEAKRAGEPPADIVAWGESMLPLFAIDPGLRAAVQQGARPAPWIDAVFDERLIDGWEQLETDWVRRGLLPGASGGQGMLPPGAVFLSGVEVLLARDGLIGRQNAITLWGANGTRTAHVGKKHLVPGAETMLGLERFAPVRKTIFALAGYVPDLLEHRGSRRLSFTDRRGREFTLSASVCFDNAYDGAFVEPLLEGPLDFHFVASNEAWFRGDQEQDQMIAFSRLAAISTGRSIVRATNSGVTAVVDPAGREVARLVVGGRDREVAGTLRADVPVPTVAGRSSQTPYVRSWRLWPSIALLWPLALLLAPRRRRAGNREPAQG